MKPKPSNKYRQLQKCFLGLNWILQGSVLERFYTIKVGDKPKRCGPYYSWTRKIHAKTVTTALSKSQYQVLKGAIANQRQASKILTRMRKMSESVLLKATQGVMKRNLVRLPK